MLSMIGRSEAARFEEETVSRNGGGPRNGTSPRFPCQSTAISRWKGQGATLQPVGRRGDAADRHLGPFSRNSSDTSPSPLLVSLGFLLPLAKSTLRPRAALYYCPQTSYRRAKTSSRINNASVSSVTRKNLIQRSLRSSVVSVVLMANFAWREEKQILLPQGGIRMTCPAAAGAERSVAKNLLLVAAAPRCVGALKGRRTLRSPFWLRPLGRAAPSCP